MKKTSSPPKLFHRFFRWFCHPELVNSIEGDLMELYYERLKRDGERSANIKFIIDVLLLLRPGIIKPIRKNRNSNTYGMYKSYFKIGWRNIMNNKAFSAINIFGLAFGLVACLFILQFVSFESSFDSFNEKLERTYRITNDRFQNGKLIQHGTIMYPTIGAAMSKDYPEIEEYTRLMPVGQLNVKMDDKNFRDDECQFVDEHFLSVFNFPLLAGNKTNLLKDPYTAVLTASVAKKYFELTDNTLATAIGKIFYWGLDQHPYEVRGICKDVPANSHIQFDVLISYSTLVAQDPDADNSWTWSDMYYYVVLKPGVDYKTLESKFPDFSERYFRGDKVSGSVEKFYLQPMKDAHLYSDYEYDFGVTTSGKAVWGTLIVAIFILIIAWINYINLSTSKALDRAKEVGLRKVMGAFRSQLINQFIFESLLISSFAFVVAIGLMFAFQPEFNQIVGKDLSWHTLFTTINSKKVFLIVGGLLVGAIISGFYPAFVLSRYSPVTILRGKFTRSSRGGFLRTVLVVFQFTSSAALISGTLIASKQIKFMSNSDLGINLEKILVVRPPELTRFDSTFISRVENYKNELKNIPGVLGATTSGRIPGDRLGRNFGFRLTDQPADARYTMSHVGIDYDFFETFKIDLLAGRTFSFTDHSADYNQLNTVVVNMNAVKLFGMNNPEEAIGKELVWGNNASRKWKIIGVVKDYHQQGLQKPMEPMIFRPLYGTEAPASIKFSSDNARMVITKIEDVYKKFFPDNSFEYFFLSDRFNDQYNDDKRFGEIITIFTLLAISIACLGLIGLSSHMAVLRTKEIGIRKALGASLYNIISILSGNHVRLVFLACVLSIPIAYFGMNKWLEGYAYHINPNWLLFVYSTVLIMLIAVVTVIFQVLKTALVNPVDTLKYE